MKTEARKEYEKKYRAANRQKRAAQIKEYQAANKDKIQAQKKEYYAANKNKILAQQNEYHKNRRATDFIYKLKGNIRSRLNKALKGRVKIGSAVKDWGCTDEFLRAYLQSKFTEGMTLENYGLWHVDHIIPLSSAETPEDILRLSHYSNLQPLWAADNLAKSDK